MTRGSVFAALLLLVACGEAPAHEFPEADHQSFARSCPTGEPKCDCSWDHIIHSMTAEEYEAAMERYVREGLMDPRLTRARAACLDAK